MVTKTSLLKQMEELIEEPGLTCCICREGYKFQVSIQSNVGCHRLIKIKIIQMCLTYVGTFLM